MRQDEIKRHGAAHAVAKQEARPCDLRRQCIQGSGNDLFAHRRPRRVPPRPRGSAVTRPVQGRGRQTCASQVRRERAVATAVFSQPVHDEHARTRTCRTPQGAAHGPCG